MSRTNAVTEDGRSSRPTAREPYTLSRFDVAIGHSAPTAREPRPTVTERCACGSTITSEPDEQSIEVAVQAHQRQPEHRAYAALQQLAGNFVAMQPIEVLARIQIPVRRLS